MQFVIIYSNQTSKLVKDEIELKGILIKESGVIDSVYALAYEVTFKVTTECTLNV